MGRADGSAVADLTGRQAAAPLLFELFAAIGPAVPLPARADKTSARASPILARFEIRIKGRREAAPPSIVFPPEGASLERQADARGKPRPIVVKLEGGTAPFSWLADGRPLEPGSRRRHARWSPGGRGYATLTVIDAAGRSDTVRVYVATQP
jgi:penicillin-binding protein 1C